LWPWATVLFAGAVWWFGIRPLAMWAADEVFPRNVGTLMILVAIFVFSTLAAGTTGLAGFLVRDGIIRHLVQGRINTARCPACKHSLLGLPLLPGTTEESVRCPECGTALPLAMIGLRHRDLIPPSARGSSPLWGCLPEDNDVL